MSHGLVSVRSAQKVVLASFVGVFYVIIIKPRIRGRWLQLTWSKTCEDPKGRCLYQVRNIVVFFGGVFLFVC